MTLPFSRAKRVRRVDPERLRTPRLRRGARIGHPAEKLALTALTGAALALLLALPDPREPRVLGIAVLAALSLGLFVRYTTAFHAKIIASFPKVATACALAFAIVFVARLSSWMGPAFPPQAVPLSLATLCGVLVLGQRFALELTLFLSPFLTLALGGEPARSFETVGMLVAGALMAALSVSRVRKRSTLVRVGIVIAFVHMATLGGVSFLTERPWDRAFVDELVFVALHGVAVGFLLSGLLPAIEYLFHATTDISLLELGNTQEHPLLKKLLVEAPGTFHHSYIVGILSEAAAEAVGANPLLARVGALYHDVGKLNKPEYFAENSPEARARHKALTPEMSTLIIAAHPRDGIEIGTYYDLPPSILAFMPEHHGTTRIEYFYQAALKRHGASGVVESDFRYPGPRPQSRETAICMLADSVEAISRQMPEPTPPRLQAMIREVLLKRVVDGQFDECGITFLELKQIEEAFLQVLIGIFHTRPTYPKGPPNPLDLSQPQEIRFGNSRALREGATGAGARPQPS
ncbi:MAG: HDIG domain-containing protein [Planctomycetes bacterium]|nr:HDIG domain-containing protein [Planctomycetota bacterium]